VRSRVAGYPGLLLRIDQVVTLTLGNDWRQADEERFDRELAEGSLAFFEPAAIPRVDQALPAAVTDVHFQVDLTGVPPIDTAAYRRVGGLFTAALRR
jgi:hypothetical protein